MKLRNLFFIGFAAAALFAACDETDNTVEGNPSITLSDASVEFDEAASSKTITVTSTRDWVATVPTSASGWLTVTPASGSANETYTVTIEVKENTENDRTAEVEFNASIISETLSVSQAGPAGPSGPTGPTTYAEIYNAATGAAVEAEGVVVGIYNAGMVISKDNDNILAYNNSSNFLPPEVKIGDNVRVSGTKGAYGDLAQIAFSYDDIEILSSGNEVTYPTPQIVDATNISSFDRTYCSYVQYEGLLTVDGYYYDVAIDGTTVEGSIQYPLESFNLAQYDGRRVVFTGYYCGGTDTRIRILLVSVEESGTPYFTVSPSSVSIPASGGNSGEISISGNVAWTATCDNDDVFTLSQTSGTGAGTITVSAAANETDAVRNATITISTTSEVSQKTYTVAVTQSVVIEGAANRADFETFNDGSTSTSYITSTTTSGWTATNCAILTGGETDNNPTYACIGKVGDTDQYAMAACMNGRTDKVGTIESPVLSGGCGILSFNYAHTYSESNGISFKVDILQNNSVVKTFTVTNTAASQSTAYEWTDNVNISGDFSIKFTNLSPSNTSGSNKDRYAVWNVEWTNYAE